MIDPSTGLDRPAANNLTQVRTSDGKPVARDPLPDASVDLDATVDSETGSTISAGKEKKVGFLKAKFNNFINTSMSATKKRTRQVQDIVGIGQLLEDRPGGNKQKPSASTKFYIQYKAEQASPEKQQRQSRGGSMEEQKEPTAEGTEAELDRQVLYECSDIQTATYIVAKLKAQM